MSDEQKTEAAEPQAEAKAEAPRAEGRKRGRDGQAAAQREKKGRAPATMPGRRAQFKFAAEAVGASSILAATWLDKPEDLEAGDGLVLGLFYFRSPEKNRGKNQVWKVRRKGGELAKKLVGDGADTIEVYRAHYKPVIQEQKDAAKQAKADAKAAKKAEREAKKAKAAEKPAEEPAAAQA